MIFLSGMNLSDQCSGAGLTVGLEGTRASTIPERVPAIAWIMDAHVVYLPMFYFPDMFLVFMSHVNCGVPRSVAAEVT